MNSSGNVANHLHPAPQALGAVTIGAAAAAVYYQQRYHTSSQSSTIKNFRSMDNTESLTCGDRRDNLSRGGGGRGVAGGRLGGSGAQNPNLIHDNTSSSLQKVSHGEEHMPNRPQTMLSKTNLKGGRETSRVGCRNGDEIKITNGSGGNQLKKPG